ncbi:type IV pilus biogenesis/stability protein PilW [Shewanella yunxiaonensis]|uniref:Type IV pilus biogenesis/stability protein PilW n=1 Tax=Shewanella yunxiaonensis TaxID=2829809 RepID=A0ABX7YQ36_9GAMM|nr:MULTISPECIES: type IV pilus biogenesis/stability protein PilW [Shewanella]MDF0534833.1 type IV pilus biogenesis/stability protein PilW [Shewanella sp. A32]QUN04750.1 type IV pilus biogenesis/stability protein PilW [Shewanella yunxiaonensis]
MKHELWGLAMLAAICSTLPGCVTEKTYAGTDIPVVEHKFDKNAAALERVQLGLTYLKKGNTEQAKFNLDKAMGYAPDLEEVNVALAYYYQTVGEKQKAEDTYERAINASNATGDAANNFGVFLCQNGKYAKSEKMFLRAVHNPKYNRIASSYENLGICQRKAGEIEKARQYFEMALKYEPNRQVSLLELTEMELGQGNYQAAKVQMDRYHRVAMDSALSLALAIKIARGLHDSEAAKSYGVLLLAKFPTSPQAKEYRASMH